jgi:hypothetical protein
MQRGARPSAPVAAALCRPGEQQGRAAYLHPPPVAHCQQPPLADVHARDWRVHEVGVQRLHHADVPHLRAAG